MVEPLKLTEVLLFGNSYRVVAVPAVPEVALLALPDLSYQVLTVVPDDTAMPVALTSLPSSHNFSPEIFAGLKAHPEDELADDIGGLLHNFCNFMLDW